MTQKKLLLKNIRLGKKGIFFTIDIIIAVIFVMILMTILVSNLNYIAKPQFQNNLAQDSLNILNSKGYLSNFSLNDSLLTLYLRNIPENYCGNIEIFNSSSVPEKKYFSQACDGDYKVNVAFSSFIFNDSAYYAKANFCTKKSCCSNYDCQAGDTCVKGTCNSNALAFYTLDKEFLDVGINNFNLNCTTSCPSWNSSTGAYKFNGSEYLFNDSISLNFSNSNELTLVAWVYVDSFSSSSWIYITDVSGTDLYFSGINSTGNLVWKMGQNFLISSERQLSLSNWHFVALSAKPSPTNIVTSVYLDGTMIGENDEGISSLANGKKIYIGTNSGLLNNFTGSISDITIYNKSLSQTELNSLYQKRR